MRLTRGQRRTLRPCQVYLGLLSHLRGQGLQYQRRTAQGVDRIYLRVVFLLILTALGRFITCRRVGVYRPGRRASVRRVRRHVRRQRNGQGVVLHVHGPDNGRLVLEIYRVRYLVVRNVCRIKVR